MVSRKLFFVIVIFSITSCSGDGDGNPFSWFRGGWGLGGQRTWAGLRSNLRVPQAEPEPEPSFGRRFFNPGFVSPEPTYRQPFPEPFSIPEPEPEPEPEPIIRRFGGFFSDPPVQNFIETQEPSLNLLPFSAESPPPTESNPPPSNPPPNPPPPSPPQSSGPSLRSLEPEFFVQELFEPSVWNVDENLFEIVPAVPYKEESRSLKIVEVSQDLPSLQNIQSTSNDYEEFYDLLSCEFDCVTKFCNLKKNQNCEEKCKNICNQ